jgi:AcrR family transcriptional regulator
MQIQKLNIHFKQARVELMERFERKEREYNMRRKEILNQAEIIFARKGFHNVTMAEIAAASGFSTGALYQFFKGKENLYITMISEKLDLLYAEVRKAPADTENIIDRIETLIDAHLQFVERNTNFLILFIKGEKASLSEDMAALHQKLGERYYDHITFIENLLNEGAARGVLRNLPSRDMAESLFYLIRAAAVGWMINPKKEALLSKKRFIMDIFLYGVKNNG